MINEMQTHSDTDMKEEKPYEGSQTFQKPLAIYYAIVLLVLLVLNLVFVPWLTERQVKEVDYGTFMSMTAENRSARWTSSPTRSCSPIKKKKQIYKTGLMNDPA